MDYVNYNPALEMGLYFESKYDSMEIEEIAIEYGDLHNLAGFEAAFDSKMETQMEHHAVDALTIEMSELEIAKSDKKKKKYGPDQIRLFIQIMQEEGTTVPKAAARTMIPRSTAYKLFNEFNEGDGTVLPGILSKGKNRGTRQKLFAEHAKFLVKLFDENPSYTLGMAIEKLALNFNGMTISPPSLWKFITEQCALSLKQASKYTQERDSPRTLDLRHTIVGSWKANGVDFKTDCVFIDEAGFNTHMIRNRAWSKVGEPASVKVHTQRGANISLVGCISPFGTINFSKVEPLLKSDAEKIEKEFHQESSSKKRKSIDTSQAKPLKKGTTAYHIVKFVEAVMDVLDRHDKKGFFIVLDNCRIHHSAFVVEAIKKRGYKPLFMPPYSPFLNPIEECWAKIKSDIKRNPLDKADQLTPRIASACQKVSVSDCQGWIRHSESFWDRCINKEVGLR